MAEILNLKNGICDTEKGSYLLLINPRQIPHLVYLQDGRYYSLTFKGIELGFSFSPFLEKLIRLKKEVIFLEVEKPNQSPFEVFNNYVVAGEQEHTCFYPIKQLLLENSSAQMIFELIPELYMNGMIKSALQIGLNDFIQEGDNFKMNTYSKADILNHISDLKKRYAER